MVQTRILLLKVPNFSYFGEGRTDRFSQKRSCGYQPSYALAMMAGFLKKFLKIDRELKVEDANKFFLGSASPSAEGLRAYMTSIIEGNDFDIIGISSQDTYCRSTGI